MSELISITDNISYLKATENPLSADVVFVKQSDCTWIFDVGSSDKAFEEIQRITGQKNIVISHFHQDHTANLSRLSYDKLFVGGYSAKFVNATVLIEETDFGERISIMPIPSSHSKGCLVLRCGDYAFVGDAIYLTEKKGRPCYNAQKLKEEIDFLKKLDVKYIGVSHARVFVRPKQGIIRMLETIYSKRNGNDPWIWMDEF